MTIHNHKIKDRIPSLMQEALHYSPTLLCLQEVDRLSDHLPSLTLQYDYTHFVGYKEKSHGLLIAWRREVFRKVSPIFQRARARETADGNGG